MAETNGRGIPSELVDYLFYAPVGVIVTVVEEIPGYVAKGRARLEGRIGTARTIGEFAVAMGRRRVEKALAERAQPPKAEQTAPEAPAASAPAEPGVPEVPARREPSGRASVGEAAGSAAEHGAPAPPGSAPGASADLAIPGYDSLAASQVVQRLAGLSTEELAEVRQYEESTRGRRTVLGRISQLTSARGMPETV